MMFPKCSKKHILMVSLNVIKKMEFNGIEKASKVELDDKDLLTHIAARQLGFVKHSQQNHVF